MTSNPLSPLQSWLDSLDDADLRAVLVSGVDRFPELADWLDTVRIAQSDDASGLLALVNRDLAPHRRFYDYRAANEYARGAGDVVDLLVNRAERADPGLVPVIERAITLVTRAVLKSDDSSGAQGALVRGLLDAHAKSVRTASPPLSQKEQTRLIKWIVKYRYGGMQDFFDPDIVAYAPGLAMRSIEQYREAIANTELGEYGYYPLTRLAVLDRDRDAIVAANRGEPHNEMLAARIVSDLEEAGLHDDALHYARLGVAMESRGWDARLVTFLVEDAVARGALDEATGLRRDWYQRFPSEPAFAALRTAAETDSTWEAERTAAEELLAARAPAAFVTYLLREQRVDEAWRFANDYAESLRDLAVWLNLCEARAHEHPRDVLPVYRQLVLDVLTVTDKRNYRTAARLLQTMRGVAQQTGADADAEFVAFLDDVVQQNRRRPTFIEILVRAKLIPRLGR